MPEVSIFPSVFAWKTPHNVDLIRYLEDTRDGEWEDIVTECRAIKDYDERKLFKEKMPTTTLSGTFSIRNDNSLQTHSGVIAMDLDGVEELNKLRKRFIADRYVLSVFMSTSGNGLRVLFRVDPDKHNDAFKGIRNYIFEEYKELADPNSSLSKPYIVSFDPYLYLNPDWDKVPTFKKYIKEKVIKDIPNFVHTSGDFEEIFKQIEDKHINICEDYNDWLKICYALVHQFGENGRGYFHKLSQFSAKYTFKRVDKQYDYCLKSKSSSQATISTFYYLAKLNGIKIVSEQTKAIVRATKSGKRAGLKPEQISENLVKQNILGVDDIVKKIFEDPLNDDLDETESILEDLEYFLSNNYDLVMNEVTGYLEYRNSTDHLSQEDLNTIFVSAKKKIPKLDYQLMMRLLKSSYIETYNPFFKFFGSDGVAVILPAIPDEEEKEYSSPLIDLLAQTIENESPAFTVFFVRKWLVSIISSAHKVHSPLMLCLLGGQNTGKTEWFRRLLPTELQSYYAESKLDKEKDDELLMTENILIVDDEFGGKSKRDNIKLKNLTSKQWFSLRRPYGDHNEKIRRLAVLGATSNIKEILSDTTGNRRTIPIEVNNINKDLYNSIDKKELFMEAFRLYKEGFDWRINQKDVSYLNKDQQEYEVVVTERELIEKYFEPWEECPKEDRMTTTDIYIELQKITGLQKLGSHSVGGELLKLSYPRISTRINAYSTPKLWCVKRINRGSGGVVPF